MANTIKVDIDHVEGRTFEGIGGITSNGMSKLLMDYPEEQRKIFLTFYSNPTLEQATTLKSGNRL